MNIQEPENLKNMAHIVDGVVVNVSLWDGKTKWEPAEEIVEIPEGTIAGIGWDWDGKKFVDNRPQPEPFGTINETE
jgi:hypothetical protein